MARFDLDQYDTVEVRLARFWEAHPEGRVLTSVMFHDERRFICRAEIYFDRDDPTPVASGYAEEIVGASPVNKTSALENCETSAIGRALANCNFASLGKRPSKEEMEKVQRYAAEPRKPAVERKTRTVTDEDRSRATEIADLCLTVDDLEVLREVWGNNTELLEVPITLGGLGTTLKDVINSRASEIQTAVA